MTSGSPSTGRWLPLLALPVLACAMTAVVAWNLLIEGPFLWHLMQPSSIQGGAEALGLMAVLCLAALRMHRVTTIVAAIVCLLYLRRHNAELPLIIGLAYLETLYALGCLIRARLGSTDPETADSTCLAWVLGLATWLLACMGLSALSLATPTILATVLFLGGAAALLIRRRSLAFSLFRHLRAQPRNDRIVAALIAGWLLVLLAKSANVIGYDTIWYIGQGDRLLAPGGSIFQSLGLVAPVHYFPKLWETLLLPMTAFDELRIQEGFGVAMLAALLVAIWLVAQRIGIARPWRWWLLWVLVTLPAIANSSLTLKTDLPCAFFLLLMCAQLADWFDRRSLDALAYAMACAALACSTKLTAIPYVGMAVIVLAIAELWRRARRPALPVSTSITTMTPAGWVTAAAALAVALLFACRTWWLAGVPTIGPDALMALWQRLGMDLSEPAGTLQWTRPQVWHDVPQLLHDWLLAPNTMSNVQITWTGNVWIVLPAVAALAAVSGWRSRSGRAATGILALPLFLAITGLLLAVAWRYHSRGSDGNYFILAVALATCLGMRALAGRFHDRRSAEWILATTLLSIGSFHAGYSFISTAWAQPGTRPFDTTFTQSPWQPGQWRTSRLRQAGLAVITAHLEGRPPGERGLGYAISGQQPHAMLPIAVEDLHSIGYSRPDYVRDGAALLAYMRDYDIRHLILPDADVENDARVATWRKAVVEAGWQQQHDDGNVLYSAPARSGPIRD